MQNTTDPAAARTAALAADPYAAYEQLRAEGPVHRITGPDGRPAWLVTRYEDVRRALADPRLSLDKRHALPGSYRGFALPPALDANLLNMDPPDHTRVRRLVARAFTPGRVEKLRAPVRRVADTLLDAVVADGETDLLRSYAGPLPITVICDLLGVPEQDRHDFRAWTDAMLVPDPARPEAASSSASLRAAAPSEPVSRATVVACSCPPSMSPAARSPSMRVIERWCCWARTSVGASRAAWPPESTTRSIARSATTVLPEATSPCSSRCIGWSAARSARISDSTSR